MKNKIRTHKWISLGIIVIFIFVVCGLVYIVTNKDSQIESQDSINQVVVNTNDTTNDQSIPPPSVVSPEPTPPPAATTVKPKPPVTAPQWPVQLTSSQASSLTVVVNKKHKLPSTYIPATVTVAGGSLRPESATAFNTMVNAASSSGIVLSYGSGYRSYARQEQLYSNYVATDGQAAADTYSARPGHSEHQTGLAVDVTDGSSCYLETCFADRPAGQWIATNAYKYGFVIRYPKGKDAITGYQYEPWHLRYLGVNEATAVFNSGKTLEEYYNVPGGGYN